ncbi:MAG: 30S ribosomal protein S17 [Candidatus Ryanbacteria bacterium RIFCSPHIGHO2_12_FULL_47_12b]|uniref:Small ribosomal subunit protein uS17 n=2 Tax=Candidatus Ryaniibacteriota TaxID=1817914 RepID=A0A1G2H335_9BACT|nr:MAG: 30S ribosomal protein S17 [Parcubacteria group bacterium GW2011_GWA2_47_10b]KKU86085.1 MAG: 30S ribosomal protein S17 [Parcubacteria group bacterium GW2011_GWA1_47_9]OGZ44743.1 MAG: 30S ribosomal protein S17 [Candidatus Ryanbacteria bacterium RIFCSPHIGHO2_01_FULL_48_80]OGZ48291.1 MAG: 30S ribosomal protein S17 [Candidatus Ryanbacteria bacterium RIFCSPHIGHO2_02_FULL_47_25]OGZ52213.1 MAG: 30S ribosomal protein S17 [Candidatus Ryanbacteria bacterium RIFCSPLOWO2_01_FULL_47_79]OGZ52881.1 MA
MNEKHPQRLKGTVVSTKMAKTVVVAVTRLKKHPRYKKYFRVTKKYKAHDEQETSKEGDTVILESTRPLSKGKRWKIVMEKEI